jgi:uncharacterized phage protein (TIGR01671 family)
MRDIKFKVRDLINNIWISNFCIWSDTNIYQLNVVSDSQPILHKLLNQRDYELVQYTWLKDRNWKEIYEGDIIWWFSVKVSSKSYSWVLQWIVEWDNEWCDYNLVYRLWDTEKYMIRAFWLQWEDNHYGVIGNVYENKDLVSKQWLWRLN